jgi:uncharacterized protein YuzE
MAVIKITLDDAGEGYISLSSAEIRHSVALDELEQAEVIPSLGAIVLDFDYYGRLAGIRVINAAESVLPPELLDQAERT